MDKSLYYNGSKQLDPTMGCVLNKIAKEERNKEAWLKIARAVNAYCDGQTKTLKSGLLKA